MVKVLSKHLEKTDIDINAVDASNMTGFQWALKNKHENVITYFLENRFENDLSVISQVGDQGSQFFQFACEIGYNVWVEMLLQKSNKLRPCPVCFNFWNKNTDCFWFVSNIILHFYQKAKTSVAGIPERKGNCPETV